MNGQLKYQSLIDDQNLQIPCPDNSCIPIQKIAYRWVKSDFSDGQSFLPNFIYDQNRGRPPRKNDPTDDYKCSMCALSFFENINASERSVETIGGPSRIKKLLGYSHIAEGKLDRDDGLAGIVDETGHFLLFEFVNVVLEG